MHFVHNDMFWKAGDVADQVAAIGWLNHPRPDLRPDRIWPLIQNGSRDLPWQQHGRAYTIDTFLHIQPMAHRDDAVFGDCIDRTADPADEPAGHRRGMDQ